MKTYAGDVNEESRSSALPECPPLSDLDPLNRPLDRSMDLWRKAAHVPTANPTPLGKPLAQYGGTKKEGIAWLERQQERIKAAQRILVVGGGALGVRECVSEKQGFLLCSRADEPHTLL